MFYKWSFKVVPLVLLLIAINLETSESQLIFSNVFKTGAKILRNVFNLVGGVTKFFGEYLEGAIIDELDDMTPRNNEAFDFIIVGAGSAGATIASRLSEISNISVLLIEAGIAENKIMDIPLLAPYLSLTDFINWDYKTEPSSNYCLGMRNKQCKWPRGKVMGGTSVLNYMIATRGSHEDYDNWTKLGCDGWSWNDVFPIFKKMENFEVKGKVIESEYHGTGGPLNIAEPPYRTQASRAFLEAGQERGFPIVDYNGKGMIGFSPFYATIKNGMRMSSNRAYLYPAKNRKNLFLTKYSRATKILIDEKTKKAYGVEIVKFGRKIRVRAKKEVIVSTGAIDSPKLLMLSGIGPAAHLKEKNIRLVKDAPVGENLMDHVSYWGLTFFVNDTITIVQKDLFAPTSTATADYLNNHKGPISSNAACEAVAFLNIENLSTSQGWPDIELLMSGTALGSGPFASALMNLDTVHGKFFEPMRDRQSFMIVPTLLHPKSKGKILVRSNRYQDDPKIIPNYFDHPDDMKKMILAIRESIKVIRTEAMQKYDAKLPDYPVPGCEKHQADSDEYWDCAVRTFANSFYHPAGTCKMGAEDDKTAVVNPRLKVIGIDKLRVADTSVMPAVTSGHTNVPTTMIGEKLAQMVKEDWKLD